MMSVIRNFLGERNDLKNKILKNAVLLSQLSNLTEQYLRVCMLKKAPK